MNAAIERRIKAALLAMMLTRRLRGGSCRTSLLGLAAIARIVGTSADSMLRDLNSQPRWGARERAGVRALRALARATVAHLDRRTWRRHCAPAARAALKQLVE